MSSGLPPFSHEPLDTSRQEIRLLRIIPTLDTFRSTIHCVLEHFDLDHVRSHGTPNKNDDRSWSFAQVFEGNADITEIGFTYQALSYTWGPETNLELIVNENSFAVRENLYHFLDECRKTPLVYSYIWIDQICIDQDSMNERNHQVQQMGKIFESASQVITWLGPVTSDGSEIALTMMGEDVQNDNTPYELPERTWFVEKPRAMALCMEALFARPYWTRLWIVQEVLLATELSICLGQFRLPASRLIRFCQGQVHWFRGSSMINNAGSRFVVPKEVCELMFGLEYTAKIPAPRQTLSPTSATPWCPQKNYHTNLTQFSLSQLIENFSGLDCADPRDKVFGLLGLVSSVEGITIDYGMSCADVLGTLRSRVQPVERLQTLGIRMGIPPAEIKDILGTGRRAGEDDMIFGQPPKSNYFDDWFASRRISDDLL